MLLEAGNGGVKSENVYKNRNVEYMRATNQRRLLLDALNCRCATSHHCTRLVVTHLVIQGYNNEVLFRSANDGWPDFIIQVLFVCECNGRCSIRYQDLDDDNNITRSR